MLLLLDTSTSRLAIGIATDSGELIAEFHAEAGEGERGIHDARLAIGTETLLKKAGIVPSEISRIGLVIGPGSFTGLRIGLSFAKGFAFATGAALVPLTQHEVMAAEGPELGNALIVTPGYRDNLFYTAELNTPRAVRLISGEDLTLVQQPLLLHDSFLTNPSRFLPSEATFASVSLTTMARLTAECATPLAEFDDLEPLYLT